MVRTLQPYRTVIFDWDGTLADSAGKIVSVVKQTAEYLGLPIPEDAQIRQGIGLGLDEQLPRLFEDPPDSAVFQHHFRTLYFGGAQQAVLFPEVRLLLDELRSEGKWLAIATGMGRISLDRTLADLELADQFDVTITAEETASKPHPMMVQHVLSALAVQPHEAVMVGDTTFDLEAGNRAGTATIAVCSGVHDAADLAACQPLALLESVKELRAWV